MSGYVTLVGAGCGPDLITVRGLKAVRQADVILYDDLIPRELLAEAKPGAELIYVGKRSGHHYKKQEETTALLIQYCKERDRTFHIVRLKGGDGFVFGRGGEEMLALREAGIPCEIIPGVSSAIAVPEEFGIPVTHRGLAGSFTVITGHTADGNSSENYETLASLKGTLVFLMGLQAVPEIAEKLMANGKSGDTPAAVLSRGFMPDEEKIIGTLATIGELSKTAKTPAIFVVGKTSKLDLESTISCPLGGARVTVTGTESMTERLNALLSGAGAKVFREQSLKILPQPSNVPVDFADTQWIVFTSPNGVRIFFDTFCARGGDVRSLAGIRFAVIGPGTAGKLAGYGIRADLMPADYTGRALGKMLGEKVRPGEKLLILRAEKGTRALTDELEKAGVSYRDCGIYRTETVGVCAGGDPNQENEETDYVVFCSASGVRAWFERRKELPQGAKAVSIGPSTSEELRHYTNQPCLTADPHTAEGILNALLRDRPEQD